jgi:hypothetical protein
MSEEEGGSTQTIKYIKFYGDLNDRGDDTKAVLPREFFLKAETFAETRGFCTAMKSEIDIDTILDIDDKTRAKKAESDAKNFLIMSCRGKAFSIIARKQTAYRMYTSLKERYMPTETKDLIKLTSRFERCKMKSHDEDPFGWILELERLNDEMDDHAEGTKKLEKALMAIIVSRLLKDRYSAVITTLRGKLDDSAFTWTKFVMEITDFYEDFVKPSGRRRDGGNDRRNIALSTDNRKTGGSYKKFKGLCRECGKQGHKAENCWQKNGNAGMNRVGGSGGKSFTGDCYNCGKSGHMSRNCPDKQGGGNKAHQGMFVGVALREKEYCGMDSNVED